VGVVCLTRRLGFGGWGLTELLRDRLVRDVLSRNGSEAKLDALAAEVAEKKWFFYSAVDDLLKI
jgi:hypothetical protein